jgi:hypothetical protein
MKKTIYNGADRRVGAGLVRERTAQNRKSNYKQ